MTLIHKGDNHTDLLYQFIGAGYSPGGNFGSGRITALKLELNKIFCFIQSQQLTKSAIDGIVVVDDEATHNKMSVAMSAMNSKLFLKTVICRITLIRTWKFWIATELSQSVGYLASEVARSKAS